MLNAPLTWSNLDGEMADPSDSDASEERYHRLTPEQIVALEHTANGMTSKEIARALGKSKTAIDQRLDRARDVLGASSRREAARLFSHWQSTCDRITRDPEPLAPAAKFPPFPNPESRDDAVSAFRVMDIAATEPFAPNPQIRTTNWIQEGIRPDDLSKLSRTAIIAACAIAGVLVPAGLAITVLVLYRLARAVWDASLI